MQAEQEALAYISEKVDELLKHFGDYDLPPKLRSAITDIYNLYHTSLRTDILSVLLPIIGLLRVRIGAGEVSYFAGPSFIAGVTEAVKRRCQELVAAKKMAASAAAQVGPHIAPVLETVQLLARRCAEGDEEAFIFVLRQMKEVLDALTALDAAARR